MELIERTGPKSPALGRATLIAALVLLAASIAASVINGLEAVPYVDTSELFSYSVSSDSGDPAEVAHAYKLQEHWIFGLLVGVAVLTIAIMAAVVKRGRASAVLAIVIVLLTPVVSLVVFVAVIASGV